MNIEFHYYMTKLLALNAGFEQDEAEIIAYSSQYVDDNNQSFQIETPEGEMYSNYISQTMNITKPKKQLMRVYLLFHFLPGDPTSYRARRKDGKMHMLMVTPASSHAQELYYDATTTENLYLLGIASHMLSDTLSHQNFVGTFDEINAMKGLWETLTPNIGHADAGYRPDIPNLIWEDPRLVKSHSLIDNKERVLTAAQKLYSNFLIITSMPSKWAATKEILSNIIGDPIEESEIKKYKTHQKARIKKFQEHFQEMGIKEDYDLTTWFNEAVENDVKFLNDKKFKFDPIKDKLTFKKNYKRSDWYRFQSAVKEYQRLATSKLEPILTQLEIKEW